MTLAASEIVGNYCGDHRCQSCPYSFQRETLSEPCPCTNHIFSKVLDVLTPACSGVLAAKVKVLPSSLFLVCIQYAQFLLRAVLRDLSGFKKINLYKSCT